VTQSSRPCRRTGAQVKIVSDYLRAQQMIAEAQKRKHAAWLAGYNRCTPRASRPGPACSPEPWLPVGAKLRAQPRACQGGLIPTPSLVGLW
jgi:hypothetical protein